MDPDTDSDPDWDVFSLLTFKMPSKNQWNELFLHIKSQITLFKG
jgi:hypothetical protein